MSKSNFKYFLALSAQEVANGASDGVALGAGLGHGGGRPKNWPGNVGVGSAGCGSKVGCSTGSEAAPGAISKTNSSNSRRVDEALREGKRNEKKEKRRGKSLHIAELL